MRSALFNKLPFLLLFVAIAHCQGPPPQMVNPHTQIRWPISCTNPKQAYSYGDNACLTVGPVGPGTGEVQINVGGVWTSVPGLTFDMPSNTLHAPNLMVPGNANVIIPPGQVTWPPSCSTGTYVPASNTCVATGTAANPAGSTGNVQYNGGGVFQAIPNSSVDGSGNVTLPSMVTAPASTTSAAKVINPQAPPYNAYGDTLIKTTSLTISTGGVTSGFVFASTDATAPVKWLDALCADAGQMFHSFSGTFVSVDGSGNATLTPAPAQSCTAATWVYGHNDHGTDTLGTRGTGIQQALTDALACAPDCRVFFPTGGYLSSPLTWKGQPVDGAGAGLSVLYGLPGSDYLQVPDGLNVPLFTTVTNLSFLVDESLDVSGAPAYGNTPAGSGFGVPCTYPSTTPPYPCRITGTQTGHTPIDQSLGGPSNPGGTYLCANGTLNAGATTVTTGGTGCFSSAFTNVPLPMVVGQPIWIDGAGPAGTTSTAIASCAAASFVVTCQATNTLAAGNTIKLGGFTSGGNVLNGRYVQILAAGLSGSQFAFNFFLPDVAAIEPGSFTVPYAGTIATVPNANAVTFSPATSTTVPSRAFGAWGNPPVGPNGEYYCGNAAISITNTDWNNRASSGPNAWTFRNVEFNTIWGRTPWESHTCAVYMQGSGNGYEMHWDTVRFTHLYGGHIESMPALNMSFASFVPTPDTSTYKDITFFFDYVPFVIYNGSHRRINGLNVYDANNPLYMGPLSFGTPNGFPATTINEYYDESFLNRIGEHARWTGYANILAGNMAQTNNGYGNQYINFVTNLSEVSAFAPQIVIGSGGSRYGGNKFSSLAGTNTGSSAIADNGWGDKVIIKPNPSFREISRGAQAPMQPMGSLDASFLGVNASTPYANSTDALFICSDIPNQISNGQCVLDPTGSEITDSYYHMTGNTGAGTNTPSSYANGKMVVGRDIPVGKQYFIVEGRCYTNACNSLFKLWDVTGGSVNIKSCSFSFGLAPAWTDQGGISSSAPCLVDTTALAGHQIVWNTNSFSGSPSAYDLAWEGFAPTHPDIVAESTALSVASPINQFKGSGAPVSYTAANWTFGAAAVADATSPVGFSSTVTNAANISAASGVSGSTALFSMPQVQSTDTLVTISTQSTGNLTDTLNGAMDNVQTTMTVTNGAVTGWTQNTLVLIDQEIIKITGTVTGAQTTYTGLLRNQLGTQPQPHSNAATVILLITGSWGVTCNGIAYNVPIAFEPSWAYWSAQLPMQNCNGYAITNRMNINSVTGTVSKVASMTLAQVGNQIRTCGTTTACSNASGGAIPRIVWGSVPLVGGTATVTGMTAWGATSSFGCTCTDTATTPAACSVQNTSNTSITVKGTGTDVVTYHCVGN